MALQDILLVNNQQPDNLANIMEQLVGESVRKIDVTPDRVRAVKPILKQYISFWREQPDIFVDFLVGRTQNETEEEKEQNKNKFQLQFQQRIMLRAIMRHKYVQCTFPRAMGKSFMAVLVLFLRCILFPGAHLFVSTGGKDQAASITLEKAEELRTLIPALNNELNLERGKTKTSKADLSYKFKNGSELDILAASERSRGARRTGGLLEECILIDQTILNEVLIPTMNVNRRLADNSRNEEEPTNKSQCYVTTAGWKNSFAYEKCIEILVQQITEPGKAFCMGGSWRIPVMEKLISRNFVQELRVSGTYNDASFAREYESEWAGDVENAFFSAEKFDKHRILNQPEYEYSGRSAKNAYYILGVDVGRKGCTTEIVVIKVTPQPQGQSIKSIVNIQSQDAEHFGLQAITIKKLFYKYKAKKVVIDGNGLGIGLLDFMVMNQTDPETGDFLPNFGVDNDEENFYKPFKDADTEENAIWVVKANAPINTDAHSYVQSQLSSGKLLFLIDESLAKQKLMATKMGSEMNADKRADYLKPFTLTSILKEQMMNLIEENEGVNIILKPSSKKIPHDKFSALEYGLYQIKLQEERKRKNKRFSAKDFMFFNSN